MKMKKENCENSDRRHPFLQASFVIFIGEKLTKYRFFPFAYQNYNRAAACWQEAIVNNACERSWRNVICTQNVFSKKRVVEKERKTPGPALS